MKNGWKLATVVLGCALVIVLAGVASGVVFSTTVTGKSVTQVKAVRSLTLQTYTDTSFTNLNGASTSVTVPSKTKAIILIRFSAAEACWGGGGIDYCYVQALVDGSPVPPGQVYFDTNNNLGDGQNSTEAHSFEFSTDKLGPGTHTVQMQVRVDVSGCCTVQMDFSQFSMTVERIAA